MFASCFHVSKSPRLQLVGLELAVAIYNHPAYTEVRDSSGIAVFLPVHTLAHLSPLFSSLATSRHTTIRRFTQGRHRVQPCSCAQPFLHPDMS